jgi:ABC-2 type transport system permease protein
MRILAYFGLLGFQPRRIQFLDHFDLLHSLLRQSYPLDLFSDPIRRAATWILPLAFVNYFPALALLGRVAPDGILPFGLTPIALALSAPIVALLYLGIAVVIWDRSVMRYQGTGT